MKQKQNNNKEKSVKPKTTSLRKINKIDELIIRLTRKKKKKNRLPTSRMREMASLEIS